MCLSYNPAVFKSTRSNCNNEGNLEDAKSGHFAPAYPHNPHRERCAMCGVLCAVCGMLYVCETPHDGCLLVCLYISLVARSVCVHVPVDILLLFKFCSYSTGWMKKQNLKTPPVGLGFTKYFERVISRVSRCRTCRGQMLPHRPTCGVRSKFDTCAVRHRGHILTEPGCKSPGRARTCFFLVL